MRADDAKPGLWVRRGAVLGFLRQEANGWDVLTPDGLRLQGVDLSEWEPADHVPPVAEAEPPTLVEKHTTDTLRVGVKPRSRGGDQ